MLGNRREPRAIDIHTVAFQKRKVSSIEPVPNTLQCTRISQTLQEFCKFLKLHQVILLKPIWIEVHHIIAQPPHFLKPVNESRLVDVQSNFIPTLVGA